MALTALSSGFMYRFAAFISLPFFAFALPKEGKVQSGEVSSQSKGSSLHLQVDTKHSVIDWKSFSIAEHESVHFNLPSQDSALLNNVTGKECSHLMGKLNSSQGRIYIINPNGIIIGKNAILNVASLVASTLQITNESFFKGEDYFVGDSSAKIINMGTVSSQRGDINVVARHIENHGLIEAPSGSVHLIAKNEAWLQPQNNKKVLIRTPLIESAEGEGITNTGTIRALQTKLDADGNLYKFAINHVGAIEATKCEEEGGRVFLRAEKGLAKVVGSIEAPGGEVEILAERIGVDDEALIDVSDKISAGSIHLGGAWRGENTPFRAEHTYLGSHAALRANGLGRGSGGTIVVWGDQSARLCGEVSARGGVCGGDGGRIEISRVPYLRSEKVWSDAPMGKKGSLLIDPVDVTITSASQSPDVTETVGTYDYSGLEPSISIAVEDGAWGNGINTLLQSNNVVIETTMADNGGNGNIVVDAAITLGNGNSLTLTAVDEGSIQINASITDTSRDTGTAITLNAREVIFGNEQLTNNHILAQADTVAVVHTGIASSRSLKLYNAAIEADSTSISGDPNLFIESATSAGTGSGLRVHDSLSLRGLNIISQEAHAYLTGLNGGSTTLTVTGDVNIGATGSSSYNATVSQFSTVDIGGALTIYNTAGGSASLSFSSPTEAALDVGSNFLIQSSGGGDASINMSTNHDFVIGGTTPLEGLLIQTFSTGDAKITHSGEGSLRINGGDSPGHIYIDTEADSDGDALISAALGDLILNTEGNIYLTSEGRGSSHISLTSADPKRLIIGSEGPVGDVFLETHGEGSGSAYINVTDGSVDISCGYLLLYNLKESSSTGSGELAGSSAFVFAGDELQINAAYGVTLTNSGSVTGTETHGLCTFLQGEGSFNISSSDSVTLLCDSSFDAVLAGVGIVTAGDCGIQSRGDISLSDAGLAANQSSSVSIIGGGTTTIDGYTLTLSTQRGSEIQVVGGANLDVVVQGALSLSAHENATEGFATLNGVNRLTVDSVGPITGNGSGNALNVKFQSTEGPVDINSGASLNLTDSLVSGSGDITMTADSNIHLNSYANLSSSGGSVLLASDQASESPGSGHVDIASTASIAANNRLRIFCGYFENNSISTASGILNGGTFSGVEDVADDNNIYEIFYDPYDLPAQYTAPYTFYYEATTPNEVIVQEVGLGNILLSAILVSSSNLSEDAAYTWLDAWENREMKRKWRRRAMNQGQNLWFKSPFGSGKRPNKIDFEKLKKSWNHKK